MDTLHRAFRDIKLTGNRFVRDVVDILVSQACRYCSLESFWAASLHRFPEEVEALSALVAFSPDDESSSGYLVIDEGRFAGIMAVEL